MKNNKELMNGLIGRMQNFVNGICEVLQMII